MTNMCRQYLITALWASTGDDAQPLDDAYGVEDIAPDSITQAEADCARFVEMAGGLLANQDDEMVGHDLWLTRNGHGAGFWDGDYPEPIGKALTDLAHKMGELNPYVADDGMVYLA